jgi:hypothetical protein
MKIRKELIGSKVFSTMMSRWILIEEGQEKMLVAFGITGIFEEKQPKIKKNAKDKQESSDELSGNDDGINNDIESGIPI